MTDDSNGHEADNPSQAESLTYDLNADERPSEAVVTAVAAVTDTSVLDLDPLYHVIDPEHLDGLITGRTGNGIPAESSVTFHFSGCRVTVTQDTVHVQIETE